MQRNVGTLDAYIRLFGGLAMMAGGIVNAVNDRRASGWDRLMMLAGAMKIAEGVTGWCPMYAALGISTVPDDTDARVVKDPGGTIAGASVIEMTPHITN